MISFVCVFNCLLIIFPSFIQRTSTCCQQTESRVRSQRALWVNRWSMSQIMVWRGQAWSSTRFQLSPQYTTSNMTMTSTSTSTTWWRPPSTDCLVSFSADDSSSCWPVVTCYSVTDFSSPSVGDDVPKIESPVYFFFFLASRGFFFILSLQDLLVFDDQ